jgi:hypothetical protein
MSKDGSQVRYSEAFWRAHHGGVVAECIESTALLRGIRSAEGFRQLANQVQSGAAANRSANCSTAAGA